MTGYVFYSTAVIYFLKYVLSLWILSRKDWGLEKRFSRRKATLKSDIPLKQTFSFFCYNSFLPSAE